MSYGTCGFLLYKNIQRNQKYDLFVSFKVFLGLTTVVLVKRFAESQQPHEFNLMFSSIQFNSTFFFNPLGQSKREAQSSTHPWTSQDIKTQNMNNKSKTTLLHQKVHVSIKVHHNMKVKCINSTLQHKEENLFHENPVLYFRDIKPTYILYYK